MKKAFIIFSLFCFTSSLWAQEATADKLVLTPRTSYTLNPGNTDGKFYVTVGLDGPEGRKYSALQMDIVLPEGVDLVYQGDDPKLSIRTVEGGIFPKVAKYVGDDDDDEPIYEYEYVHKLSFNVITEKGKRLLRIGCHSDNLDDFVKSSGDILRFYPTVSSYVKPQDDLFVVENVKFIMNNGDYYIPTVQAKGISVSTSASATLAVNAANQWSTCILPFATALPEGVKAYECNEQDGDNLVLTKAESIEAYTPYLLYAPEGLSATTVTGTIDPTGYPEQGFVSKGYLSGALKSTNIFVGSYVLQNKGDGAKFYPVEFQKTFTMPAGKCWLNDNVASASALRLDTDYVTDGVTTITNKAKNNETVYNIDGTQATTMQPGRLYIKGGKTILKIR